MVLYIVTEMTEVDYKIKRWKNNLPLKMAGFFWMFLFIMSDFDTKKSVFLVFNENFRIEI